MTNSSHSTEDLAHDALVTPKSVRLSQTAPRCPPSEYQADPMLRHMTGSTRRLRKILPLSLQNSLRDGGIFRWIADSAVSSLAVPTGAIACPSAAREFVVLSKKCRKLHYGDHESQFVDVFFPDPSNEYSARGMVFFVHGGAWGSGKPWFYRLVTKAFLEVGLAVAIVGYRVYPLCGVPGDFDSRGGVLTQVDDIGAAFAKLAEEYPEWCDKNFEDRLVEEGQNSQSHRHAHHLPHLGTIVIGHSSGAHISMLWMVEEAQKQTLKVPIEALVGVSGVYNIGHHFDFEAGRGVEEISPLKPANGYDYKSFQRFSPPWKVQNELLRNHDETNPLFPGRILLLHGAEDDVVPLPGTCEAAKILKDCLGGGPSSNNTSKNYNESDVIIDEYYLPRTGHQDTVMDLMMLGGHKGPVTRTVVEWVLNGNRQLMQKRNQNRKVKNTIRSKL